MRNIPIGWSISTLRDAMLPGRDGFIDGDWVEADYITNSGIRLIQTGNIGIGEFLDKSGSRKYISKASFRILNCTSVNAGDVLICRLADPIGRACEIPNDIGSAITAVDCTITRIDDSRHDKTFILQWLNSYYNLKAAADMAAGSTRSRISRSNLGKLPLPTPPKNEQAAIGRVLDTLDTTIRQTEAIIEKLKQVKQGLLHDLLTRGIDANGELRPPQSEAPELYKESALGWIPNEWDELPLRECTEWSSGGTPNRSVSSNWVGEVPILTPKDMKRFELSDTIEHISSGAAESGSRLMPAGTIFMVVRGMILAHSFPVVYSLCPMAFNQDIKAISARPGLNALFLAHWFIAQKDHFLRKVTEATHGTKKLDSDDLLSISIGIPSEPEQAAIIERYESLDRTMWQENKFVQQMQALKSGLMDDLLTGRVRVTPLLNTPD